MEKDWDVDDSDLPSLVFLRPCSDSNKHSHCLIPPLSPTTSPPPRLIPGPAGKIQTAMIRKRRLESSSDELPIPTQEFLQNAAQDSDRSYHDDDDFKSIAWISAIRFLSTGQSIMNVVLPATPLSSLHNRIPDSRVNQVVAIITSCMPNGLGDMTVTLKDPTGIIDGTIHRKVLTESEFAKDISVKATLILKKVSIFAPSPKTVYLNITRSNVVKVFRNDTAPLIGHTHHAPKVTYLPSESGNNASSRDKNTGTENEALRARQCSAATEIYEAASGMDVADDNQVTLDNNEKWQTSDNLSEGHRSSGFIANLNGDKDDEVQQADKHVKQRSMSKVSLPQWTDEQLLELFDDDPLFECK